MSRDDPRFGPAGLSLIRAGKQLRAYGLISGLEGDLSCRLPGGTVMISAAGVRKDHLTPDELIIVNLASEPIQGRKQPSSELPLHLAIYQARAEIEAIVHAHPPAATAFAVAQQTPDSSILAEAAALLGGVKLVPFQDPGSKALGLSAVERLKSAQVLLLAQHGAVTVGESIEAALIRMELLEKLCDIEIRARILGGAQRLDPIALAALHSMGD